MIDGVSSAERTESVLQFIVRSASLSVGQEVSENTDLFDFGLDSLSALELSAAIEEQYPIECPPEEIFEHPVIAELTQLLVRRGAGADA